MTKPEEQKRIKELRKLIEHHQKLYHEQDAPEISDEAYDSLVRELRELSGETDTYEPYAVGGAPSEAFSKVTHQVRQWSFSNVFTQQELVDWEARLKRHLENEDVSYDHMTYVVEHKIDGLKVILRYEGGRLVQAATRGDGFIGEDVTHTVRTIKTIPQTLSQPIDLICVGEVWLSQKEFQRINKEREAAGEPLFANPRNAAAGSLRQLDPEVTRGRNLSVFVYDIDFFATKNTKLNEPETQWEELELLGQLGLPVNPHNQKCQDIAAIEAYYDTWQDKRKDQAYGIDGVVIKVNEIRLQRALGYTAKSPRYGTAFKFKAEQATTVIEDIQLQVGRTGAVTPVAHLRPVLIDGSTVSRATLHNEDQIKRLDVRVGDTVILQKAGDIIPEILEVITELRPATTKPFRFPKKVEGCGGDGSIERIPGEAAYRCKVLDSDFLHRQRLYHFVSKGALNIDGVGPRIIDLLLDKGLITYHYDLFTLEVGDLKNLPGFKEKAAQNVIDAIAAARKVPLHRLLIGLSIDQVGEETARLLADTFGTLDALAAASVADLAAVYGVGETVGEAVVTWFSDNKNQDRLAELLKHIEVEKPKRTVGSSKLKGKTVIFTGSLEHYTRDEAKDLARQAGANVTSSVSKKTDYVIVGKDPGSKAEKATTLGVTILSEAEYAKLLKS